MASKNDDSMKPAPVQEKTPSNVVAVDEFTVSGIGMTGIHKFQKKTDDGLKTINLVVSTK